MTEADVSYDLRVDFFISSTKRDEWAREQDSNLSRRRGMCSNDAVMLGMPYSFPTYRMFHRIGRMDNVTWSTVMRSI